MIAVLWFRICHHTRYAHDTRAPGVGISDGESGGYEENADFVGGFCVYFEVGM
jgi:hypothetical protein